MKLFLISQNVNRGYDTYDSAIVVADHEDRAKRVSPDRFHIWKDDTWHFTYNDGTSEPDVFDSWAFPSDITAEYLGEASKKYKEEECILASFNAG